MRPALIVTRPLAQALPWLNALRACGIDARALPLIEIEPVADTAALEAAWGQIDACAAFMFVSANAVAHFFAARPPGIPWPEGVIAACTGPGTGAALRNAGVPEADLVLPQDGQSQESESLWQVLSGRDWRARRVMVVRGEEGRDWLAERWRSRGAEVEFLTAYQRRMPALNGDRLALLNEVQDAPSRWIWHFSSAQAVSHLCALAPRMHWSCESAALATHPRVAQAARTAGFGRVREVAPGVDAVVHALLAQGSSGGATYNPGGHAPAEE